MRRHGSQDALQRPHPLTGEERAEGGDSHRSGSLPRPHPHSLSIYWSPFLPDGRQPHPKGLACQAKGRAH